MASPRKCSDSLAMSPWSRPPSRNQVLPRFVPFASGARNSSVDRRHVRNAPSAMASRAGGLARQHRAPEGTSARPRRRRSHRNCSSAILESFPDREYLYRHGRTGRDDDLAAAPFRRLWHRASSVGVGKKRGRRRRVGAWFARACAARRMAAASRSSPAGRRHGPAVDPSQRTRCWTKTDDWLAAKRTPVAALPSIATDFLKALDSSQAGTRTTSPLRGLRGHTDELSFLCAANGAYMASNATCVVWPALLRNAGTTSCF